MSREPDEGFLARWSRRKAERPSEAEPSGDAQPKTATEDLPAAPAAPPAGEPPLTEAEIAALPPVEEVGDAEALKVFLRKGAPAVLKRAAMRRMWLLNPAIVGHVDPAVDYAWDWNVIGDAPGYAPLGPSEENTAMIRRILDGPDPAPEQDRDPVAAAQAEAGAPSQTAPTRPRTSAPAPTDHVDHPPGGAAETAAPQAAAPQAADAAPARARHGGARPV